MTIGDEAAALEREHPKRDYRAPVVDALEAGDYGRYLEALEEFVDWRIRKREVGL